MNRPDWQLSIFIVNHLFSFWKTWLIICKWCLNISEANLNQNENLKFLQMTFRQTRPQFFSWIQLETSWDLIQSFFNRCILLNFAGFVFHSIFVKSFSSEVFSTFCCSVFLEEKKRHETTLPKMLLKCFETLIWVIKLLWKQWLHIASNVKCEKISTIRKDMKKCF